MKFRSVTLPFILGIIFLLFGEVHTLHAQLAQSPYNFSKKKDLTILGLSSGLFTSSFFIGRKRGVMDEDHWKALDRNRVFYFDRSVTYYWSNSARKLSDGLLYSSIALPFALTITRKSHNQMAAVGLMTLETALLNLGLTNFTKNLVARHRPFTYNHESVPWEIMSKQKLKDARRSFFSGHTSTTASMYFMTAQMYSDFHPNSKFRSVAWVGAITIPALTGLMRVKAGKHYYTDIIMGYAVGAVIGILIPRLHK